MEMSKRDRTISIIGFVVLMLYFLYLFVKAGSNASKLEEHSSYAITDGVITEVFYGYRNPPQFYYNFEVGGITYKGHISVPTNLRSVNKRELAKFIGDTYQVRYVISDPDINKMMFLY